MDVPSYVPIVGWGVFAVIFLISGLFSFLYIRHYRNKRYSVCSSTATAIVALMVTFSSLALAPVDVFVVSVMKESNGTFKDWASDNATREKVEDAILYTYYALYSLIVTFLYLVIPFAIFFYEEEEEDIRTATRVLRALKFTLCFTGFARVLRALKFTLCFTGFAVIVLLVGAFIPVRSEPPVDKHTAWQEVEYLLHSLGETKGENALYFLISFISLVGLLAIVVYMSYGMVIIPIDLLRGKRDTEEEIGDVRSRRDRNQERRRHLERRYGERRTSAGRYRDQQDELEDEEQLIQRREERLVAIRDGSKGFIHKCSLLWWPFRITIAVTILMMDALIIVSLFLANLDKALHSEGAKTGYNLPRSVLPSPIDLFLLLCQVVFPLDLVIFVSLLVFFMWASMAGIKKIGVWFCCLKMYRIRPHRTRAQGVLFMCMFMMYILMALNILMFTIAPEYLSFGNQNYIANDTTIKPCTLDAGDECIPTVTRALLTQFTFNFWFFGLCYYWVTWLFIGMILVSTVIALLKKPTSEIEGAVDSSDLDESDDEMMQT